MPTAAAISTQLGLSNKQSQIVSLIMAGCTPQKLAAQMSISPSTLEKHLAALRQKLKANLADSLTRDLLALLYGIPSQSTVPPQHFMRVEPFSAAALAPYANANSPEQAARLRENGEVIGNAVSLCSWMTRHAEVPAEANTVFANWNLDGDRGYGAKSWSGIANLVLPEGNIPLQFRRYDPTLQPADWAALLAPRLAVSPAGWQNNIYHINGVVTPADSAFFMSNTALKRPSAPPQEM